MSATDGGPAFGGSYDEVFVDMSGQKEPFRLERRAPGMSLRDYFAAHAPLTDDVLLATNDVAMDMAPQTRERYGDVFCRLLAEHAYRYADAMLSAREKGAQS